MSYTFLANVANTGEKLTFGGMAVVFGLLMLFMKLLGKINKRGGKSDSTILTIWHLGPKREIQVLRLGDQVHYIYRHDGSMVILKEESYEQYLLNHETEAKDAHTDPFWKKLLTQKNTIQESQTTA